MDFTHACIDVHNVRMFNAVRWVPPPVGPSACSASQDGVSLGLGLSSSHAPGEALNHFRLSILSVF